MHTRWEPSARESVAYWWKMCLGQPAAICLCSVSQQMRRSDLTNGFWSVAEPVSLVSAGGQIVAQRQVQSSKHDSELLGYLFWSSRPLRSGRFQLHDLLVKHSSLANRNHHMCGLKILPGTGLQHHSALSCCLLLASQQLHGVLSCDLLAKHSSWANRNRHVFGLKMSPFH